MNDSDVVGLRALAENATPGPWMYIAHHAQGDWSGAGRGPVHQIHPDNLAIAGKAADAQLIEAAVNALPALLDEITTLRAEVADRNARITAARKELGGYILQETQDGGSGDPAVVRADDVLAGLHDTDGGSCWCGPRVVDVPSAVPVPQDNPEATRSALAALEVGYDDESDLSFRCPSCGWSTHNREVEQHICSASPVPPPDVRPKNGEKP